MFVFLDILRKRMFEWKKNRIYKLSAFASLQYIVD